MQEAFTKEKALDIAYIQAQLLKLQQDVADMQQLTAWRVGNLLGLAT